MENDHTTSKVNPVTAAGCSVQGPKRPSASAAAAFHRQQQARSRYGWLAPLVLCALVNLTGAQELGGSGASGDSAGVKAAKWLAIAALVCISGLSAGLTLGFMGLDQVGLQIVAEGGDAKEAKAAKKIIPLRKRGNLLLCTLVVMNVAINSLISILSAGLAGGLLGFACSTVLITIFGEIVPQAVCSRHALQIGAAVGPVMYVMMVLFYPICKPLAFILDKCLGEEVGTIHTRTELRELLNIHVKHGAIDVETGREMAGALKYKDLLVRAVMTPKEKVFMLSADARLDYRTVRAIFGTGFSRIPVHGASTDDIVGLLFTKDLIFIDPVDATPVKNFIQVFGRAVHAVWPDQPLGVCAVTTTSTSSILWLNSHLFAQGQRGCGWVQVWSVAASCCTAQALTHRSSDQLLQHKCLCTTWTLGADLMAMTGGRIR
eukprot:TRINITY_DN10065_c1_g1_i2.p1 TRINITY_DN10065_c1_g1~~TRINITY_DN10065_c1_g1_i2.p1  ORF type:complete len:432 (-),score=90.93 TRINITY_DN10065_c1_g1_i2:191-1486(-)